VNRRWSRTLALGALLLACASLVAVVFAAAHPGGEAAVEAGTLGAVRPFFAPVRRHRLPPPPPAVPDEDAIADADDWLATRAGRTAFACVDSAGVLHGVRVHERFHSASLVKAMLLTAYLEAVDEQERPLTSAEAALLEPMIEVSDNDAASAIFARVGQDGLQRLALQAGMTDFSPSAAWGLTEISAADQARFFSRLDELLPDRSEAFARRLLRSVTPSQRWGIPAAAEPRGWRVLFKGGWLEGIVNQAARIEREDGTTLSLAVLTDGNSSMGYGIETIEGVASRLLA